MPWQMQFGSYDRDNASADYACCRFKAYLFRSDCDIALPGGKIEGAIFKRICWIITPIRYTHICRRWGSRKRLRRKRVATLTFVITSLTERIPDSYMRVSRRICISIPATPRFRSRRVAYTRAQSEYSYAVIISRPTRCTSLSFLSQYRPSLL